MKDAKFLLKRLGLPKKQQNDRSAWTFLALAYIKPNDSWSMASSPLVTTREIMDFISKNYGKEYKPNSRESIRKGTLHQFEQATLIERNRDNPKRATNSKDNNYSLNSYIVDILRAYPDGNWEELLEKHLKERPTLKELYEKKLDKEKIPITLPDGTKYKLSPGAHNQLHADIIHEFCSRFVGRKGIVLYIGDTASSRSEGGKLMHLEADYLTKLGVPPMAHEKLPDVVVYDTERKWLFLIEAVTSRGPVSHKRWVELEKVLSNCTVGRVYVTAFPDQKEFKKHASEIAWESEVWLANNPDHMIHFNGDRFLGPHETKEKN